MIIRHAHERRSAGDGGHAMALSTATAKGAPTLAELAERAEALLPRLRERAELAEQLRRIPDETIQDFRIGFIAPCVCRDPPL